MKKKTTRNNSDIMYQDWLSPYQLYDSFNLYFVSDLPKMVTEIILIF